MADLSINLALPNSKTAGQRMLWCAYPCVTVLVACFIVYVRFAHISPKFGLNGFELMPLTGLVSGALPHFLFRLMHNLTHPVLLAACVSIVIYLAIRIVASPRKPRFRDNLQEMTAIMILVLFCAYLGSLFLPVGDMAEIIKNP